MPKYLSVNRCPHHQEYWSIAIEDADGCGTRLTPGKCCGSWVTVKRWQMSESDLMKTVHTLLAEAAASHTIVEPPLALEATAPTTTRPPDVESGLRSQLAVTRGLERQLALMSTLALNHFWHSPLTETIEAARLLATRQAMQILKKLPSNERTEG